MPLRKSGFVVYITKAYTYTIHLKNTVTNMFYFTFSLSVCQSIDIRNSPSEFKLLKPCRIIEGFLIISLIDNYNETDYDNLEFPALTEITDFFILYRVNGLKSLLKLFPNLRVIRGNNLVQDYAFIVYEMMNLHVSRLLLFIIHLCVL